MKKLAMVVLISLMVVCPAFATKYYIPASVLNRGLVVDANALTATVENGVLVLHGSGTVGGSLTALGFSTYMQTLIDDANSTRARATLDVNQTTLGISTFIQTLTDDANAINARATLGLGTMATQNANSIAVTGGTLMGITDANDANHFVSNKLGLPIADFVADTNDPNGTLAYPTAYALKVYDVNGTLMGYVPVMPAKW